MSRRTNAARKIDFYQDTKRGITALEGALKRSQARLEETIKELARERAEYEGTIRELEARHQSYKKRLVGLLDDRQREHARITGCAEDEYAIQLIRLCNQKIAELSSLRSYP